MVLLWNRRLHTHWKGQFSDSHPPLMGLTHLRLPTAGVELWALQRRPPTHTHTHTHSLSLTLCQAQTHWACGRGGAAPGAPWPPSPGCPGLCPPWVPTPWPARGGAPGIPSGIVGWGGGKDQPSLGHRKLLPGAHL